MSHIPNIHPGEILQEEFLVPLNISAYRLAKETQLPATRISQIIHKKRSITADTALRLSAFFETSPDFWLGLQHEYDIRQEARHLKKTLQNISSYRQFAVNS